MSFIDRYCDFMAAITDAPREYQEACALFLLSTAAGRHFIFHSIPDAEIFGGNPSGGKFLNLWFILIGKSRIMRKTTVAKRGKELIKNINDKLLLPDDFTPQAFVSIMNRKMLGGQTKAAWVNDEISGFFEQLNRADFMATTDTLLSKIYDGDTYHRETIVRGAEPVINPYLTILLASTEYLPTLFEESRMRQGFLNRFIYVPSEERTRISLRTRLTGKERKEAQEILEWLEAVYERGTQVPLMMAFTDESRKIYDAYEIRIEKRIESADLDMLEGYWGNLPNFLLRIASLYRIARMSLADVATYARPALLVEGKDMEWGAKYCVKIWKWFEQVIEMMGSSFESRKVFTDMREQEMVFNIIKKEGGIVDRSIVYKKTRLNPKRLNEVLGALMIQERIEQKEVPTGGRPKIVYELI